jgi:hypothetical protein
MRDYEENPLRLEDDIGDLDDDPSEDSSDMDEWFPDNGRNDRDWGINVIPRFEKVGLKPLYVRPRCSIHTYSNNMIHMQCSIKHNNYLLHNDPWV